MLAVSPCFESGSVCSSVAETVQTHRPCMRQGQRGLERLTASCPSDGCVCGLTGIRSYRLIQREKRQRWPCATSDPNEGKWKCPVGIRDAASRRPRRRTWSSSAGKRAVRLRAIKEHVTWPLGQSGMKSLKKKHHKNLLKAVCCFVATYKPPFVSVNGWILMWSNC